MTTRYKSIASKSLQAARRKSGLALIAGLAVSLASAPEAPAISFVKLSTNHDAWDAVLMPVRDDMGNITGTEVRPVTGAGVTVGMIEAAQPNLDHIAFEGLEFQRIWYPFETALAQDVSTVRRELLPTTDQGSLRIPADFHRHATAVAGAIAGRNESLFGDFRFFGPLTGIARDADLLTGALSTGVDPVSGDFERGSIFPAMLLFTMAAMTDVDIDEDGEGDFIEAVADWYGVEPWEPASVINISFGDVGDETGQRRRAGEDAFARLANIIAWRTDTVIVAAVGDSAEAEFLDELEEDEGSIASPASALNVIAVGRTGSGGDIEERQEDSGVGPVLRFDWLAREGDQYLLDPETNMDYEDVEFMGGDPRQGDPVVFPGGGGDEPERVALDILAPGTLLTLPANPLNGPFFLSSVDVWEGWSGTSFASAVVTGAVALMQEYGREWEHSTDPVLLRAVLMNSAEKTQGWSNAASNSDDVNIDEETLEALDPEAGAGVLDFQRLLIQYAATPAGGGYADINESNQFILQSFRPVFWRAGELTDPPTDTPPGPDYSPRGNVGGVLIRYAEFAEGATSPTEFFYTDPGRAAVTAYADPTRLMGQLRTPPGTIQETQVDEALQADAGEDDSAGWSNFAQPIASDRFGFVPGGGIDRFGGFGGGGTNRPGGVTSGFGLGAQEGGGGSGDPDGGGSTPPPQDGSLRPCNALNQSRCSRTGWDVGRLGLGFIDLPIGLLPEGSDVTATLVWHRAEDLTDEAFERVLNGVISQDPPPPASTGRAADDETAAPVLYGPEPAVDAPSKGAPSPRTLQVWEGMRPNRKLVPLLMAGVTLRGPGPDFVDLDRDKDGANDAAMPGLLDTCFIDPGGLLAITFSGLPVQVMSDSYDPEQIDMDNDGCGPPCDPNDVPPGLEIGPESQCTPTIPSGGPTPNDFDSERMRRVTDAYYTTPVDELGVDPLALNGVVALRIRDGEDFRFATGVLLNDRRLITAAHVLDTDSDGVSDVTPQNVQIFFPTFNRNNPVLQYGQAAEIAIHPSFNFVGDRTTSPEPDESVENGRDDLAIVTVGGQTFSEFVDAIFAEGAIAYDGDQLQFYPIVESAPPDEGTQEIVIAGYGESGDGRFGIPMDPNAPLDEAPPGFVPVSLSPNELSPVPNMRYGRNVVDLYPLDVDDDDEDAEVESTLIESFFFDFDDPDDASAGGLGGGSLGNRVETTITRGDSGSPAFFHNDANMNGAVDPGELRLFGINTAADVIDGQLNAAGEEAFSFFGTQAQGMVLNAYTGTDDEGNLRFIDAILADMPPMPQGQLNFSSDRGHLEDQIAFKFDNLDLELRRRATDGTGDRIIYRSAAAGNVEHVYATDLEDFGFYYLRIVWSGPEFDWGGFQFDGQVPFRPVQPVASSNHDLTSADIVDFWPAEVKYGLAWWADLPFNRIFEGSSGRSNASADAFLGDMDADMAVDAADIAMLMSHWNTSGPKGDLNEDGRVDAKDLMILLSNYGS